MTCCGYNKLSDSGAGLNTASLSHRFIRETLRISSFALFILKINIRNITRKMDCETPPEAASVNMSAGWHRWRRREWKQKRRKRVMLQAKLKATPHKVPLPSIFLANIWSISNKMDELRLRITSQRGTDRNCYILILTETWLNCNIPNIPAMELTGRTLFHASRKQETDFVYMWTVPGASMKLPQTDTAHLIWNISWWDADLSIFLGNYLWFLQLQFTYCTLLVIIGKHSRYYNQPLANPSRISPEFLCFF